MKALSDFYRALNTRDIELMARNWAPTTDAVMDNPVGGIMRGWEAIRAVYERVFSSSGKYWFEFYDYSYHDAGEIFYVVGRERGEYSAGEAVLHGDQDEQSLPTDRWRMATGASSRLYR
jgi:ketosteroid isomerase-like protein